MLRDDPIAELNDLVQKSDDQLLERLSFAVGENNGKKTIVLKVDAESWAKSLPALQLVSAAGAPLPSRGQGVPS